MKIGDYLGAQDDYTRVVLNHPEAEIFEHRGWAYLFADAWQPALHDFDEAIRLDADEAAAPVATGADGKGASARGTRPTPPDLAVTSGKPRGVMPIC